MLEIGHGCSWGEISEPYQHLKIRIYSKPKPFLVERKVSTRIKKRLHLTLAVYSCILTLTDLFLAMGYCDLLCG